MLGLGFVASLAILWVIHNYGKFKISVAIPLIENANAFSDIYTNRCGKRKVILGPASRTQSAQLAGKNQQISINLKYNSFTASTSANKANLLNQFFNSYFTSPTTPPSASYLQFLVDHHFGENESYSCLWR